MAASGVASNGVTSIAVCVEDEAVAASGVIAVCVEDEAISTIAVCEEDVALVAASGVISTIAVCVEDEALAVASGVAQTPLDPRRNAAASALATSCGGKHRVCVEVVVNLMRPLAK